MPNVLYRTARDGCSAAKTVSATGHNTLKAMRADSEKQTLRENVLTIEGNQYSVFLGGKKTIEIRSS